MGVHLRYCDVTAEPLVINFELILLTNSDNR